MPSSRKFNDIVVRYRFLLYFLLLLPVYVFRDFTPANELKYISIVDEALRNGTWFTFYNHGIIYADKPPLYFWLIMLTRFLTGGYHMWAIGLISFLPAAGTMWIMDKWLRIEGLANRPLVSNLLLLTTVMFLASTAVMRMDMMMVFFITASLYVFFKMYKGIAGRHDKYLLGLYIFLAVFSKGAMGLIVPVISITAFLAVKKELRTIGRYLGWRQWAVMLGLAALWFGMVYAEGGKEYLDNILFKQTVGRGVNSFHHKEPIWFYLPRMLWSFAPWTILYIVAIYKGIKAKAFSNDTLKFFAVTAAANIVIMSLISAKLDIYVLPIYPFIVYMCAVLLDGIWESGAVKLSVAVPAVIFSLLFSGVLIAGGYISEYLFSPLVYIAVFILSASGVAALVMTLKGKVPQAVITIALGMLLMAFTAAFALPRFNRNIGFRGIAIEMKEAADKENVDNYAYYKYSPASNMDVFIGHPLHYIESVNELDSLNALPYRTLIFVREVEKKREPEFKAWIEGRLKAGEEGVYSWYFVGGAR